MGVYPIGKLLADMAIPMMISMLVQACYNIVDSVFVSRISENALTAVSLAFPLQSLCIAVGSGTAVGMNAVLSRSLGEKRQDMVDRSANTGIFLFICSYVLFALIGIFLTKPFFYAQTDVEEILKHGISYSTICLVCSLGIFMQFCFERLLQSTGRTNLAMITQIVGAVTNIILDPILIFGLFGFPRLEVAGAALATVIGQILGASLALFFNLKKNPDIQFSLRGFRPSRSAIRGMQADVEKGDTLAGSMRRAGKLFPSMMVNMVAAGEESGNLEDSFLQMETYFERIKRTKSKVGKVMIYPCVLLVVMIIVLIVMMVKIIPMFLASFREMGTELPKLTLMVMALSDWFTAWWWALVIGIILLVVAGVLFNRTDPGRHFFGWLALHLPLLKVLTEKSACSTLCRSLSVLLGSGLTLTEAMDLAAANMTNIYYREAVMNIRFQVTAGTPLAAALQQEKLFPPMVCNLVGIGEETGALETMMAKVADYYDEEVSETTDKLMALLEPFIILIMAVFVVFIVLSIFLPMLSMTQAYDQYL